MSFCLFSHLVSLFSCCTGLSFVVNTQWFQRQLATVSFFYLIQMQTPFVLISLLHDFKPHFCIRFGNKNLTQKTIIDKFFSSFILLANMII